MKKVCLAFILVLCATGAMAQTGNATSGINETYAIISINGGANVYYDLNAATANPDFNGAALGSFTINNGGQSHILKGGQNKVYKCSGGDITACTLYYRVYKIGSLPGSFSNIALPFSSETNNGCGGKDQVWEEASATVDLLSNLPPGNYTVEIYSTADYNNTGAGGGTGVWNANNNGNNYKATCTRLADAANPVCVTASGGNAFNSYPTFSAAFSAINAGTHTGSISIIAGGNTIEPVTGSVLNGNGMGAASYTGITINPFGNITVSGAPTGGLPMIDLNGADNVVIDGLNSGGNSLTISNTRNSITAGTATLRFQADATGNTITNCSILGSAVMAAGTNGGTIVFGAAALVTGNDNNTISNCNIGPAGSNLPAKAIYCTGSSNDDPGTANNGIVISNNNIYDYFAGARSSAAIDINSGTTGITVSSNRFYQTALRTLAQADAYHHAISVNNVAGTNIQITGNTIGYAGSNGAGIYAISVAATSYFTAISLNVSNTGVTSIQGNTIAGIAVSGSGTGTGSAAPFKGIHITGGSATIGNITGNTIGSMAATGSITYTSASGGNSDVIGILNTGSSNWITNNNNIGGITGNTNGGPATMIYGMRGITSASASWVASNNTIGGAIANSIQCISGDIQSTVQGFANSGFSFTASGNTIRNLTATGGGGSNAAASVVGISTGGAAAEHNITQNTIYNLGNISFTGPNMVTGIQFTNGINSIIQRNLIYDLYISNTATASQVNGIYATNGTATYQNNMIRLGAGITSIGSTSPTGGIAGINEASGTNKFYHNSVYIEGQQSGSGVSYAFNSISTTNTRAVRNNIFFNARNSGGGGKNYIIRLAGSGINLSTLTINNNIYFANGTSPVFGSFSNADVAGLAAWRTVTGQDANSFQNDPAFQSPGTALPNLHINPSVLSVAEGNGADVGVINDYDNETRASLTPVDIGADAGNYTGADLNPPMISHAQVTNACTNGDRILTGITIIDNSGVPVTGPLTPRVYYRKNNGTWFSQPGALTSGNGQNGVWSFTIVASDMGGLIPEDSVKYYFIAQDTSVAVNIATFPAGGTASNVNSILTAPSITFKYKINTVLNGTYTIGAGGNYTTLTAAINIYNTACLTGPVTFNLTNAVYNAATETFPLQVNANADASMVNTLTISPAPGVNALITASNASAIIKFNGADYVTIDGINNNGRSLTISNTSTASGSTALWLGSTGAGAGATNDTIKNCTIQNGNIGNATVLTFGIFIGNATGIANGPDNDNIAIQNNTIKKASIGIQSIGGSTAGQQNDNTLIENNIIGDGVTANSIGRYGMEIGQTTNAVIRNNTIFNVITSSASFVAANNATGILLNTGTSNTMVTGNKINDIRYTGTSGYGGKGIDVKSGLAASNILIANNFVSNISGDGWNDVLSDGVAGIRVSIGATGGVNIYYNTVNLGSGSFAGNVDGTESGALVIGSTATNISIKNNILTTNLVNTNAAGAKTYAILAKTASNSVFTTIDYNNYYAGGAQGYIGQVGNVDAASFAAWQAASGQDAASKNIQPVFISSTDLHLNTNANNALDNMGTPIAGIGTDIDAQTRNAVTPDIGADEFTFFGYCPTANTSYTSNITGAAYQWQVDTGTGFMDIPDGPIYSGTNGITLTLTAPPTYMNTYKFRCVVDGVTYSNIFTYRVGVNWTGAISADWSVPGNWSCGTVPDQYTDVQINPGAPNYPLTGTDITIRSLRINPGAAVTIGAGFNIILTGK